MKRVQKVAQIDYITRFNINEKKKKLIIKRKYNASSLKHAKREVRQLRLSFSNLALCFFYESVRDDLTPC